MEITNAEIRAYAKRHTTQEPELLKELSEVSGRELEHIEMLSGPVVGRLLHMLIKISGTRRVLEIGTFAGYSALMMAGALPGDGEVITLEINERYGALARQFFEKSEHGYKINLVMGEALESLKTVEGPFGLVFLDADKVNYPAYYEAILPKLKPGGLIVIDNVLWSGGVLNPSDDQAKAIDRLNKRIAEDSRVEQAMITERDGLNIVRVLIKGGGGSR